METRLVGLFAVLTATQLGAQPAKPNVVLITIDTLRADHLSSYGYHLKTSPNIDRLAAEGARFDRAYTSIPLTGPAHFSLFTGRFPQEHGARRNGVAMVENRRQLAFPQVLRKHGYRSAAFISAWPLTARLTHLDRWFDQFDENLTRRYQLFNSSRYAEDVTPPAVNWMKRHANGGRPFFLWVHYFDPHYPYEIRKGFIPRERTGAGERHERDAAVRERKAAYDSEIAYTDHHIGLLLKALDDSGLRDNTLVVLTADHGESLGEHDYVGHGRHLYENIVRVPLIVRLPGKVAAGNVVESPASLIDLAPTVLDLTVTPAGSQKPPFEFTGRSLVPVLNGGGARPRPIHFVTFAGKKGFAPSWLSWMWIQNEKLPLLMGFADGRRKSIWAPSDNALRIYDVANDPLELKPQTVDSGSDRYKFETASLRRWFSATEARASEERLSKQDVEILKSLGYVQ